MTEVLTIFLDNTICYNISMYNILALQKPINGKRQAGMMYLLGNISKILIENDKERKVVFG